EIYGYILAIYTFGAMIGPLVMGFNFDLKGSYQMALIAFAVVTLLGAALMAQLGPYREWKMAESGAS
ncbi:MAG TPA: hypothetical protein VNO14_15070, partial [Blastocatellia bacterium]|nr:hypothetical protein [Blastocatellia bacterium]